MTALKNARLDAIIKRMNINSEFEMIDFGLKLGKLLKGGEIIELIGDVGSGKTTLVKGIARGLGVNDTVQSPSFTISRLYHSDKGLDLIHYDFYRLNDAGIMLDEIKESSNNPNNVIVIEWGEAVGSVLPKDRVNIKINTIDDSKRSIKIDSFGPKSKSLIDKIL